MMFNEIDHDCLVKRRNEDEYKKRTSIILCCMNLIYKLRQHVLYKSRCFLFCNSYFYKRGGNSNNRLVALKYYKGIHVIMHACQCKHETVIIYHFWPGRMPKININNGALQNCTRALSKNNQE